VEFGSDKANRILSMYSRLANGGMIYKSEEATNFGVNERTIQRDIDDIRNTFQLFANQTERLVVANGDNPEVKKINYNTNVIFYGFSFNNTAVIKNLKLTEDGSRFDIYIKEELYGSFEVQLYGKHMVSNVCAAILICKELGIPKEKIYESLKTFKNAKRRFAIEKVRNTIIIDDYAHHPTEIKVTLEAARQKYPDKRLVVVFKPNTYSRTKDFKDEFINALQVADKFYLTEIDCNREKQEDYPGITSSIITNEIEGAEIIDEEHINKLGSELNSVVCFMSCAYVDKLIESFKTYIINQPKEEK